MSIAGPQRCIERTDASSCNLAIPDEKTARNDLAVVTIETIV